MFKALMFTAPVLLILAALPVGASGFLSVFPRSARPAERLHHLDLMNAPLESRFAMTVLQGLVNREQPRLYVSQDPGWHGPGNLMRWMDDLRSRGHSFEPLSPEDAVRTYRHLIRGAALYESQLQDEPEALHKLNALTVYCALENALPVTPELNERFGLPVLLDTRGKYGSAEEAYRWVYDELWHRANRAVLAHTCPTHMVLRDYLVQHRIVPFWISRGTSRQGDWLAQRFLAEAAPNSPLLGCWGGYGEQPPGRYNEAQLQRLASLYGKFVVVSDGCFNLSVFSGLGYTRTDPPRRQQPRLEPDKVYVVFNITDGDNLQYLLQAFVGGQWWLNPGRGAVPIAWSLNPAAAVLIPNVVEYVQKTASELDEFVCSTAGIGLLAPSIYGAELDIDRNALYSDYLKMTDEGLKSLGQSCIHLGDTSEIPWARADFDRCARELTGIKGILGDYGRMLGVFPENASYTVVRDVVVFRALAGIGQGGTDEERAQRIADAIRANTPSERPAFLHACLVNWFVTPESVRRAMEMLGEDYMAVLPSEAVELFLEARRQRGADDTTPAVSPGLRPPR